MPDYSFAKTDWHRLNAASTWLSHVAKPRYPHSHDSEMVVWQAIADNDIPRAMTTAQATFTENATPALYEILGLLSLLGRNTELAQAMFTHAEEPDATVWRNRAVFALWGRDWDTAAQMFQNGLRLPNSDDSCWCRGALMTMLTIARQWDSVAHLSLQTFPEDHELYPLAHLCTMASQYGKNGLKANLFPDLDLGAFDSEGAAAPNAGSGLLQSSVTGDLICFLACDPNYLKRYGLAAVTAFAKVHQEKVLSLHLHLYDPTEQARHDIAELAKHLNLSLALTEEVSPEHACTSDKGTYYACARFCRLAEAFPQYEAPVVAIDADALIRQDLTPLINRTTHIGITLSPLTVPWNRHPAGFVLLQPTQQAQNFIKATARLIGDSLGRQQRLWFLDQWALLIAAQHPNYQNDIRHFPWRWTYDTTFSNEALVWQANDDRKHKDTPYTQAIHALMQDTPITFPST